MTVTAILLGAVALVVVMGAVGAARRRLVDEGSSVRDYQHAMDTLRHLPDRRVAVGSSSGAAGGGRRATVLARRSGPPAVSMPVEEPADAGDDGQQSAPDPHGDPTGRGSAADAVRELAAARSLHGARPSPRTMPASQRRDRRPMVWTLAAAVAVLAVTAVALAVGPGGSSTTARSTRGRSTAARATATRSTAARSTAARSATPRPTAARSTRAPSTSGRSRRAAGAPPRAGSSSAHVAPAALDPVTSTATTATYQVTSPYTLQLSGTGPCWMEATDSQTGQVLWTGTLVAGEVQSVPSTAGMLLNLGDAANVALAVGDEPVDLPPGHAATMEISFVTG